MFAQITPATEFKTGAGKVVSLKEVVIRIKEFIGDSEDYVIEVGTDVPTGRHSRHVTAIVVYKSGKGGIFFYTSAPISKVHSLRDLIHTETRLSIECANILIDLFLDNDLLFNIKICCDIGPNGRTRDLLREIVGYVTAMGFDCAVKTDEAVACHVADRFSG